MIHALRSRPAGVALLVAATLLLVASAPAAVAQTPADAPMANETAANETVEVASAFEHNEIVSVTLSAPIAADAVSDEDVRYYVNGEERYSSVSDDDGDGHLKVTSGTVPDPVDDVKLWVGELPAANGTATTTPGNVSVSGTSTSLYSPYDDSVSVYRGETLAVVAQQEGTDVAILANGEPIRVTTTGVTDDVAVETADLGAGGDYAVRVGAGENATTHPLVVRDLGLTATANATGQFTAEPIRARVAAADANRSVVVRAVGEDGTVHDRSETELNASGEATALLDAPRPGEYTVEVVDAATGIATSDDVTLAADDPWVYSATEYGGTVGVVFTEPVTTASVADPTVRVDGEVLSNVTVAHAAGANRVRVLLPTDPGAHRNVTVDFGTVETPAGGTATDVVAVPSVTQRVVAETDARDPEGNGTIVYQGEPVAVVANETGGRVQITQAGDPVLTAYLDDLSTRAFVFDTDRANVERGQTYSVEFRDGGPVRNFTVRGVYLYTNLPSETVHASERVTVQSHAARAGPARTELVNESGAVVDSQRTSVANDGWANATLTPPGAGNYTVRVTDLASGVTENATVVVEPLPPVDGAAPRDPDGDGLYEDVNGDGTTNLADAGDLFQHRDDPAVTDHVDAYDFSENGGVDLADVVDLFREV